MRVESKIPREFPPQIMVRISKVNNGKKYCVKLESVKEQYFEKAFFDKKEDAVKFASNKLMESTIL